MKVKIEKWANKYVPRFNELAQKHKAQYYTQSPLNEIDSEIDTMIVGINPKGSPYAEQFTHLDTKEFLSGNECWEKRFEDKWKFVLGARWFMGYDNRPSSDSIDNDKKTVWFNLTPFASEKGFSDLHSELINAGLESFFELTRILKPQRIILLTTQGFKQLTNKKVDEHLRDRVESIQVLTKPNIRIGLINGIHAINLPHPSGRWPISNRFAALFILLHNLSYKDANGIIRTNLKEVCNIMRDEIRAYLSNVEL